MAVEAVSEKDSDISPEGDDEGSEKTQEKRKKSTKVCFFHSLRNSVCSRGSFSSVNQPVHVFALLSSKRNILLCQKSASAQLCWMLEQCKACPDWLPMGWKPRAVVLLLGYVHRYLDIQQMFCSCSFRA